MKKSIITKILSTALCIIFAFSLVLSVGCKKESTPEEKPRVDGILSEFSDKSDMGVIFPKDQTYISNHENTTEVSYLDEFSGKKGVMKITADNVDDKGAGYLNFKVDQTDADRLIEQDFSTITIKTFIQVESVLTAKIKDLCGGTFNFTDGKSLNSVKTGQWVDVVINRADFGCGSDESALKKKLTDGSYSIYNKDVKWQKNGVYNYEYAYVVKDADDFKYKDDFDREHVLNYRIIDKKISAKTTVINYYIDSITYAKDSVKPQIYMYSDNETVVGQEYTPDFRAVDNHDANPKINSITIKNSAGAEFPLTDGKITFSESGEYTITVEGADKDGNVATRDFTLYVLTEKRKNVLNSFGNSADLSGLTFHYSEADNLYEDGQQNSSLWLPEFNGKYGVNKVVCDNCSIYGTGWIVFKLSQSQMETLVGSEYEYFTVRLYIEISSTIAETITSVDMYGVANFDALGNSINKSVKVGEWVDIKLYKNQFKYNENPTIYNERLQTGYYQFYVNNMKWDSTDDLTVLTLQQLDPVVKTKINGADNCREASKITYYIDEIGFGK